MSQIQYISTHCTVNTSLQHTIVAISYGPSLYYCSNMSRHCIEAVWEGGASQPSWLGLQELSGVKHCTFSGSTQCSSHRSSYCEVVTVLLVLLQCSTCSHFSSIEYLCNSSHCICLNALHYNVHSSTVHVLHLCASTGGCEGG